jgi:hypothetical protein
MLTQRSEGLRRLLLICQIWITAGLFWLGVWVMVKFYSPPGGLTWRRYSIYCVLLVLGLTLEYLGRDSSRDYPLQTDLLREHRVSLRQTVASIGTLVIYLIAPRTVLSSGTVIIGAAIVIDSFAKESVASGLGCPGRCCSRYFAL